jgi:hypothetical protein
MNDNLRPKRVKQKRILPFALPAENLSDSERLARIEAALCNLCSAVCHVSAHLGLPLESLPAPENDPVRVPPSLPSNKKIIDAKGRRELCRALYEHFLANPDLKGAVRPPSGNDKPRIYFEEDHSYLYFDQWGGLHAGIKGGDRQSCKAQETIDAYQLRKVL